MIFLRFAELRRILRENRDLKARIAGLEAELREERAKTERIMLALADRVLTAAGCYGLPKEVTQPKERRETKPATPEPSPQLASYLEAVRQEGVRLGKSQGEIDIMINRLKRGESVIPALEEEFTLPN
jgi:hypothetical protein